MKLLEDQNFIIGVSLAIVAYFYFTELLVM